MREGTSTGLHLRQRLLVLDTIFFQHGLVVAPNDNVNVHLGGNGNGNGKRGSGAV